MPIHRNMSWLTLQTSMVLIPIPFILIFILALGIAGLAILWRKERKIEALSALNSILLIIVIILLLFPR